VPLFNCGNHAGCSHEYLQALAAARAVLAPSAPGCQHISSAFLLLAEAARRAAAQEASASAWTCRHAMDAFLGSLAQGALSRLAASSRSCACAACTAPQLPSLRFSSHSTCSLALVAESRAVVAQHPGCRSIAERSWSCHVCRRVKPSEAYYTCPTCDYDMCTACSRSAPQMPAGAHHCRDCLGMPGDCACARCCERPSAALCSLPASTRLALHEMCSLALVSEKERRVAQNPGCKSIQVRDWTCDICRHSKPTEVFYTCPQCDWDACLTCVRGAAKLTGFNHCPHCRGGRGSCACSSACARPAGALCY